MRVEKGGVKGGGPGEVRPYFRVLLLLQLHVEVRSVGVVPRRKDVHILAYLHGSLEYVVHGLPGLLVGQVPLHEVLASAGVDEMENVYPGNLLLQRQVDDPGKVLNRVFSQGVTDADRNLGVLQVPHTLQRLFEGPLLSSEPVVRPVETVEGDADVLETGVPRHLRDLFAYQGAVGGNDGPQSLVRGVPGNLEYILTHVGLAAGEHQYLGPGVLHLVHHVQTFFGGELSLPWARGGVVAV